MHQDERRSIRQSNKLPALLSREQIARQFLQRHIAQWTILPGRGQEFLWESIEPMWHATCCLTGIRI
jgi:hypothetical protein